MSLRKLGVIASPYGRAYYVHIPSQVVYGVDMDRAEHDVLGLRADPGMGDGHLVQLQQAVPGSRRQHWDLMYYQGGIVEHDTPSRKMEPDTYHENDREIWGMDGDGEEWHCYKADQSLISRDPDGRNLTLTPGPDTHLIVNGIATRR